MLILKMVKKVRKSVKIFAKRMLIENTIKKGSYNVHFGSKNQGCARFGLICANSCCLIWHSHSITFKVSQMEINSVDSTESQENKKKSSSKMLPQWELNPGASDFHVLHDTV